MKSKAVETGINKQITLEFASAYAYLAMAAYFSEQSLNGFAHWMRMQYKEELGHAERLFDFVLDNGGHVQLDAIPKPGGTFKSPLAVMEAALKHEQKVTAAIHDLYELAIAEKAHASEMELQWFITEQVEEEKTVGDIVNQLKLAGDSGAALLIIDQALGARGPETE